MDDERRRILKLVHEGRISPSEADALLLELEAAEAAEQAGPQWREAEPGRGFGEHRRGGCAVLDGDWVSAVVARSIGRAARRSFWAVRGRRHSSC